MMKYTLWFMGFAIALMACQADGSAGAEKSVEEVQAMVDAKPTKGDNKQLRKAQDETPKDTINVGAFEFDETTFEFGTVDEGKKVEHTFKFKNTGKVPLVISNARGSCGCTVPQWPKEPIAVGETGEINVLFNTKGKKNKQTKTVTLMANTYPSSTRLLLKGTVTPDPNATKPQPQKKTNPSEGKGNLKEGK